MAIMSHMAASGIQNQKIRLDVRGTYPVIPLTLLHSRWEIQWEGSKRPNRGIGDVDDIVEDVERQPVYIPNPGVGDNSRFPESA